MGDYDKAINVVWQGMEELPADAELVYRCVAYMMEAGYLTEAINTLETALAMDYDKHKALYDFFPDLEAQKAIYKVIERFSSKAKK